MKTQGSNTDVVFLSGVRTGFGTFGGTLKDLSAIELGAVAARHALERLGCPAGRGGPQRLRQRPPDVRRRDLLRPAHRTQAGLPIEVPARHGEPAVWLGVRSDHPGPLSSFSWVKRKRCSPAARSP